MGMNVQPKISDYDVFGCTFVKNNMPRDRFKSLLRFLHFADNNAADPGDRLYKLRAILDAFNANCSATLVPGAKVVIDESMVPWRGRLGFRQYLPGKTHKYGVKLFKLCTVSAYTLRLSVYTGAAQGHHEISMVASVVHQLMRQFTGEGRTLFAGNYYTSVPVAESLLQKRTHLCGTLRSHRRGLPKEVTTRKLKKGQAIGRVSAKGVKVVKWVDKRPVLMISTTPATTRPCSPRAR